MTDVLAGVVPSVVSFGNDGNHKSNWNNGNESAYISYMGTQSLQREHFDIVRDVNSLARETQVNVEKNGSANSLVTERNGAATSLAIEKIGAANALAIEKTAAASQLAIANSQFALASKMAECCCEVKQLVMETSNRVEATVRQLDTDNAKASLQSATTELLALKYSTSNVKP